MIFDLNAVAGGVRVKKNTTVNSYKNRTSNTATYNGNKIMYYLFWMKRTRIDVSISYNTTYERECRAYCCWYTIRMCYDINYSAKPKKLSESNE